MLQCGRPLSGPIRTLAVIPKTVSMNGREAAQPLRGPVRDARRFDAVMWRNGTARARPDSHHLGTAFGCPQRGEYLLSARHLRMGTHYSNGTLSTDRRASVAYKRRGSQT